MRLKRLYIKGFKSFADETIIDFNHQVIGVVGPNGSGKSNIVDAIRWVLGEQKSRELRLDKMNDIIFNGTKKRRASGVAHVELTFENTKGLLPTEYNAVTVGRYLYQSGESEYRMNGVQCRLKDVHNLFIDTGIGSNSYAIIALGMVDDILADKENSRQKMFEQAAGISKYKTRKKETLNKLKSTEGDLDRIEDIIFELEANLKVTKKQADKARKYNDIKEKYKNETLKFVKLNLNVLESSSEELRVKVDEELIKNQSITAAINTLEADIQKAKTSHIDQEKNLSDLQKTLNSQIDAQRQDEYQKDLIQERIKNHIKRSEEISIQIESDKKEILKFQEKNKHLESVIGETQGLVDSLKMAFESTTNNHDKLKQEYQKTKANFDNFMVRKLDMEQLVQTKEREDAILVERLQNLQDQANHLQTKIEESEQRGVSDKTSMDTMKTNLSDKNNELHYILDNKNNIDLKIKDIDGEVSSENEKLAVLRRKNASLEKEYELTNEMLNNLEGYPESMKFLKDKWNPKAVLFSEIFDVAEEYQSVIELYVEPYLNYFVVDSISDALQAIKLLNDSQNGKAHFFVLDQIATHGIGKQKNPNEHGLKAVLPLVNAAHDKYKPLLNRIFQDAFFTDSNFNQLVNISGNNINLLSSKELVFKREYSLSGGSSGLFEGHKLGRRARVNKLSQEINKVNEQIHESEGRVNDLKAEKKVLQEKNDALSIDAIRQDLKKLESKHLRLETEYQLATKHIDEWKQQVKSLEKSKEALEIQKSDIRQNKLEILEQIQNLESSDTSINNKVLDQLASELNTASQKMNEAQIHFIRKENELKGLQRDLEVVMSQLQQHQTRLEQNKKDISNLDKSIKQSGIEVNEISQRLVSNYENKDSLVAKLSQIEQQFFAAKGETNKMEEALRQKNKELQQSQFLINNLKDEQKSLIFQRNGMLERLKIEFDSTKNDLSAIKIEESIDIEVLKKDLERLKSKLHSYGDVNPLALKAYEEMEIRHNTIIDQRDDILASKESLLKTIDEIEVKATDQYMVAFNKVRENFKVVFRSLFSEDDDCDLILLDGESPMNAKIEILAKPKGKKPKSLNQLSGGEKTLTATALLFALYLLKPAPFCIFDEVDAPLDDVNIQKFNKIIKKFSKESQFIVVTHNKLTMAEVGVLYGVYMQEQGVSGLTPVDLTKYDFEPVMQNSN